MSWHMQALLKAFLKKKNVKLSPGQHSFGLVNVIKLCNYYYFFEILSLHPVKLHCFSAIQLTSTCCLPDFMKRLPLWLHNQIRLEPHWPSPQHGSLHQEDFIKDVYILDCARVVFDLDFVWCLLCWQLLSHRRIWMEVTLVNMQKLGAR